MTPRWAPSLKQRFVLTAEGWHRAGLGCDPEAMGWLGRFSPPIRTLRFELVDEGTLAYFRLVADRGDLYASCSALGARLDDVITVRRFYSGPVPPQVLAAFRAECRDL